MRQLFQLLPKTITYNNKSASILSSTNNTTSCFRRFQSTGEDKLLPLSSLPMRDRVRKTLEEKGYSFKEGHANFILKCHLCTKYNTTLYVNMDSGNYLCQPCGSKGTWKQLTNWESGIKSTFLQKPKSSTSSARSVYILPFETQQESSENSTKVNSSPTPACDMKTQITPETPAPTKEERRAIKVRLEKYLKDKTRKLTQKDKELLDKLTETSCLEMSSLLLFDLRVELPDSGREEDTEEIILSWPWFENNLDKELIGIKTQHLRKVESDSNQITYSQREARPGLFGWNTITSHTKTVVITASELDAVALAQDCKTPVLTLPQGLSALPPGLLPQLEVFDKIILWLGDGIRTRQASMQFAKKLNLKRCSTIRRPNGFDLDVPYTPLKLLNKGIDLGSILESALPMRHERILTFCDIRSDVWYELYNQEEIYGLRWTRYPELTRLLKGYRRGEMSIYTGATGSGKTTLLSELSLDLCMQNVSTLWGSFEISAMRLGKTMIKQFSRNSLEERNVFERWANDFERLPMYYMSFLGATHLEQILDTMRYAVFMYDVEHVVVDNLQFMVALEYYNDKYWVQDKIVAALRKFATEKDIHISLIVHPKKERDDVILDKSSVYGTAKAIQEADNIMILHSNPGQTKALEVCKNRFDGTLGFVKLHYNSEDCTLSNAKTFKDVHSHH